MNRINVFAEEFLGTIMENKNGKSYGNKWEIAFCYDYDRQEQELYMKTVLGLYNDEGENICTVYYDVIRNKEMQYAHTVTFMMTEMLYNEYEEKSEFDKMKNEINRCREGLYDEICTYLRRYTLEQMEIGVSMDATIPPRYKELCPGNIRVKYWWTEDGDAEHCIRIEDILEEDAECYHCAATLKKGTQVSVLTSLSDNGKYVMCTTCADANSQRQM